MAAQLQCRHAPSPEAQFARATLLFQKGYLKASQDLSAAELRGVRNLPPQWTEKFTILEAESAAWRRHSEDVLRILSALPGTLADPDLELKRRALIAVSYTHMHNFSAARQAMGTSLALCVSHAYASCGAVFQAESILLMDEGDLPAAYSSISKSLSVARQFGQRIDEATALMNLGYMCLQEEHYEDAIDWSHSAASLAQEIGARDLVQNAKGNLGWAYYELGDLERAATMFQEARQSAELLGDSGATVAWLTTLGIVNQGQGNLAQARQSFVEALAIARQIHSMEDEMNSLESLIYVSIATGDQAAAKRNIGELEPLLKTHANHLDELTVVLAKGEIAASNGDNRQAERLFRSVLDDPVSQISMKLGAYHQLAKLYEGSGATANADAMYTAALAKFEATRDQLRNEDSRLPFLANATGIYDDYIHFLISQGKTLEALRTADHSRARALAQGLGATASEPARGPQLNPEAVARKAGATLLFYWLGERQSYFWAVSGQKTMLFSLPAQREIVPLIERYNKALLGTEDPIESGNSAGQELYTTLVAPAAQLLRPGTQAMILADGALSQLNFETLVVPSLSANGKAHYWIEDVTLSSAPSLAMMSAARPVSAFSNRKLLLIGNAISPSEDYPELPFAALEMQRVQKHFPSQAAVFAQRQATPQLYLNSNPRQYAYIHFVSHGVASRTDPLDSAIILSRTGGPDGVSGTAVEQGGFKLYARDVMQHPIDARLVTISACYTTGTRAYAGEGLVGLSWAFLHAGAHSAIGALWEVSDQSTPRLMDALYEGLQQGQPPAVALRDAKLALLHTRGNFRKPFYWAPFQIYTRL